MAISVRHRHHIAVTTLLTRSLDHAVTHTAHGGADRSGVIHAQMGAPGLQYGVKAQLEPAGHARKSKRRGQVSAAQTLTAQIKVAAFGGLRLLEPDRMVGFAGQHLAGTQRFAIGFK